MDQGVAKVQRPKVWCMCMRGLGQHVHTVEAGANAGVRPPQSSLETCKRHHIIKTSTLSSLFSVLTLTTRSM